MNVLITGVAGFLGSHLADQFINNGNRVVGIDNLIGGYEKNINSSVDFHNLDLDNLELIRPLFKDIDLVIHAACTAYEGLSVFAPSLVVRNTMQITTNVMSASINANVKKIVYLSSMARYGAQDKTPFEESMVPRPQDPYGIAKFASELIVKNLADTHGMNWVILVPHNIIGPRQKYDDPYRNVVSIMINRMLQGKQPVIYGNGEQKRCFSFISDVLDPILMACQTNSAHGRIVNIGPDDEFITINELAIKLSEILDFKLKPIYVPSRPQEVLYANCSADLARSILRYKTTTTLNEGLIQSVNWIKSQVTKEFTYHLDLEFESSQAPKTWVEKLI
jgi:UDP-glucose 4-epimerase